MKEVLLDGCYMDIVIQGKNSKKERPYLILKLDKETRCILGFRISSDGEICPQCGEALPFEFMAGNGTCQNCSIE
ncbi:MAG: hypothetical protein ACE3L7_13895 [Candidatus Pristimantibacillus sp.]